MRSTIGGVLAGAGVVLAIWGASTYQPTALAQRPDGFPRTALAAQGPVNPPERAAPSGELIALSFDVGGGRQQLTLVDPHTHMMGVYHVDPASGEITLKSVRNVHWDLQMDEYNGTNPSPGEIRTLLGNRR